MNNVIKEQTKWIIYTAKNPAPMKKNENSVFSGSDIWQQFISSLKFEEDP